MKLYWCRVKKHFNKGYGLYVELPYIDNGDEETDPKPLAIDDDFLEDIAEPPPELQLEVGEYIELEVKM